MMSEEKQEVTVIESDTKVSPMREKFGVFGVATFVYALLYVFCMYQNKSGITYPFFVAGSLYYFYYSAGAKSGSAYFYKVLCIFE